MYRVVSYSVAWVVIAMLGSWCRRRDEGFVMHGLTSLGFARKDFGGICAPFPCVPTIGAEVTGVSTLGVLLSGVERLSVAILRFMCQLRNLRRHDDKRRYSRYKVPASCIPDAKPQDTCHRDTVPRESVHTTPRRAKPCYRYTRGAKPSHATYRRPLELQESDSFQTNNILNRL
jgi:hypothetical protein